MAEQGIVRESLVQDRVQDGNFIDTFTSEDAFAIEVLIGVRCGPAVDIEAGLARVNGCQAGARCRANAHADARLQDAVAFHNDAHLGIDDGLVQRMSEGAHHRRR